MWPWCVKMGQQVTRTAPNSSDSRRSSRRRNVAQSMSWIEKFKLLIWSAHHDELAEHTFHPHHLEFIDPLPFHLCCCCCCCFCTLDTFSQRFFPRTSSSLHSKDSKAQFRTTFYLHPTLTCICCRILSPKLVIKMLLKFQDNVDKSPLDEQMQTFSCIKYYKPLQYP